MLLRAFLSCSWHPDLVCRWPPACSAVARDTTRARQLLHYVQSLFEPFVATEILLAEGSAANRRWPVMHDHANCNIANKLPARAVSAPPHTLLSTPFIQVLQAQNSPYQNHSAHWSGVAVSGHQHLCSALLSRPQVRSRLTCIPLCGSGGHQTRVAGIRSISLE